MLRLAVSNISSLVGLHKYKTQREALLEMKQKIARIGLPKFVDKKRAELEETLSSDPFFRVFTRSNHITKRLRQISRKVIDSKCKLLKIYHNRPWNYFIKQRGIYRENLAIEKFEKQYKQKVFDQQKRIRGYFTSLVGTKYIIQGAIDGCFEDSVLEIKVRSSEVTLPPPQWEQVQLMLYCMILEKPGRLVQEDIRGKLQHWDISFEDCQIMFERMQPQLNSIVSQLTTCLSSREKRATSAESPSERSTTRDYLKSATRACRPLPGTSES